MTKKRAVITGMGSISCIGNNLEEISNSLRQGISGISKNDEYNDLGFRSKVSGSILIDLKDLIDRKLFRFMGEAAAYSYLSALDALRDSKLPESIFETDRIGVIAGSGGASSRSQVDAADILREKGVKRVGPYRVTQTMGSTVSACLATSFKIKGVNFSISSACSTSAHCIGSAWEQIQLGNQDVIIAGGAEDEHWTQSGLFDAMGALSSNYNENPTAASRPFDENRDGFVISGGGGILIVEELEHALSRKAKIYAEVKGYSATSDGDDMVAPSGEGAKNCMKKSLEMSGLKSVDYLNAHGTSTPAGDPIELNAIKSVFKDDIPIVSSTKSLTGHTLGAAGVQECIYSILMMNGNFIAGNKNLTDPIPEADGIDIPKKSLEKEFDSFMSNSFGFGGTNVSLVLSKFKS
ncbi:MAG: beta-ketoacyl-ACP synthase I [SAR86 cluster bacterium]|uniref:3-oxoacyl-[acyl-carrier-protein] synthase 1 n=1 Tax=SAR86 cluster bacterium TaxID=2030880 RepID=A0A937I4P4_9GAMM|nr:beta-ketoacyl-ACP synthase I [SAR86 cluster bacterium]